MDISIVIVNWNSGHWLQECLASVVASVADAEIVVVDNASEDTSLAQAASFFDRVTVIRNSENRGFASGVNQGIAASTRPYVLLLNPDLTVPAGTVEALRDFLESHPRAAAAGGYLNDSYLPRRLPTWFSLVRENLGVVRSTEHLTGSQPIEVDQPAAAGLMLRRAALEQIGGMDERFFPAWYEDVDLCLRLKGLGWRIFFLPHARFIHEGGYSARALGPQAFAGAYYRNQLRYGRKHLKPAPLLVVRLSVAAGMVARMVRYPAQATAYWHVFMGALTEW